MKRAGLILVIALGYLAAAWNLDEAHAYLQLEGLNLLQFPREALLAQTGLTMTISLLGLLTGWAFVSLRAKRWVYAVTMLISFIPAIPMVFTFILRISLHFASLRVWFDLMRMPRTYSMYAATVLFWLSLYCLIWIKQKPPNQGQTGLLYS